MYVAGTPAELRYLNQMIMYFNINEVINQIDSFILPKLSKSEEERQTHPEYENRIKKLKNFHILLNLLEEVDLKEQTKPLSHLLILYKELNSAGPWNSELTKRCADKLNVTLEQLYGFSLKIISNSAFNIQDLYDKCFTILHSRVNVESFKYYPSLIEVYCVLVQDIKEYRLSINAPKVLPISLYLIDDYIEPNRIKGLKCLSAVLNILKGEAFSGGNYYEVIHRTLKNKIGDKNLEATELLLDCLLWLLKILPEDTKSAKTDEVLSMILEQLYIESNLYRKVALLRFLTNIIEIHRVNCVKRKKIKQIFCDNIDVCCNDGVAEILLSHVLECLEMWIRHCWCGWKFSSDYKLLSLLIKLLYVTKDENVKVNITHIIITLISLCTTDERKQISENLDKAQFPEKLDQIRREIVEQIVY